MNEEKIIVLKPRKNDFEEIYFSENQGSLFFFIDNERKNDYDHCCRTDFIDSLFI